MMTRLVMSNVETVQAGVLLHANLTPVEGRENLFTYNEGWSDEKVADTVGRVNAAHIARLRISLGMNLSVVSKDAGYNQLAADFKQLLDLHNKLCDLLTLNRVVDARSIKL